MMEENDMRERNVYILLTDTGTMLNRIIKVFTRQPLNHASISFDPQLKEVYSFGRKKPINPFIGGFVMEDVHGPLMFNAKSAIYTCPITEAQYLLMLTKIKKIEKQQQQYKYNLLGLFAVLFNKEFDRDKAYFCSHFVATILDGTGLELPFNKPLSLVTPHDFENIPSFRLVFRGRLSSFFDNRNNLSERRIPIIGYFLKKKNAAV